MKRAVFFLVFAILFCAGSSHAAEAIHKYDVLAVIQPDGIVDITETITVKAENNQIRHGIYRDFPTQYQDKAGQKVTIPFVIENITRDGAKEPYHTVSQSNGVRIYIGDKDTLVYPGMHTYAIQYKVYNVIGRFADKEQFYWNVTGNGWVFPIYETQFRLQLPGQAAILESSSYTGALGQKIKNYGERKKGGALYVWTTKPLSSYEGLTVSVDFPIGTTKADSKLKYYWLLLTSDKPLAIFLGFIFFALGFNFFAWLHTGREIAIGPIIPRFDLIEGVSPDLLRYVTEQGYDNKALSCFIVQQAVNGRITISEESGKLILQRKDISQSLTEIERTIFQELFSRGSRLELPKSMGFMLSSVEKEKRQIIAQQMQGAKSMHEQLFSSHATAPFPFYASRGEALVHFFDKSVDLFTRLFGYDPEDDYFSIAPVVNLLRVAIIILSVAVNFYVIGTSNDIWGWSVFAQIAIFWIFSKPMQRYSTEGQQIYEYGQGLKMYLSVAEKARLNANYPKEITPQIFEKFLPYALALGVEQKWSEHFASYIDAAGIDYQADWYPNYSSIRHLGSDLGSTLSTSISSASSPPGSSDGGGGGGFSGGGGGGGGGGGW